MLFGVSVQAVSCEYQMERTDLQCDTDLNAFRHIRHLANCKLFLPADKFPVLNDRARRITSLFGSTYEYICEQFFSKMKAAKSKR
jgi:hypothetical protein